VLAGSELRLGGGIHFDDAAAAVEDESRIGQLRDEIGHAGCDRLAFRDPIQVQRALKPDGAFRQKTWKFSVIAVSDSVTVMDGKHGSLVAVMQQFDPCSVI
jgi:hypothetical protein